MSLFRSKDGVYEQVFKNDNSHLSKLPGYGNNSHWLREGGGSNLRFKLADFSRDKEKIRDYCIKAWESKNDLRTKTDLDGFVAHVLSQDEKSIAFGYSGEREVGIIAAGDNICDVPEAGVISLLYIKPEFRRKRYGMQLVGHAMSSFKEQGKKHLSVCVSERDTEAKKLYDKFGFYKRSCKNESDSQNSIMLLDI